MRVKVEWIKREYSSILIIWENLIVFTVFINGIMFTECVNQNQSVQPAMTGTQDFIILQ